MSKRRTRGVLLALLLGAPLAASIPGGSTIVAILGISFLIFIHEWGHFYACKLTGTRTETFSIGFGPRLFGWEKSRDGERRFTVGRRQLDPADHSMDFRIAAVPLGGYVKMAGEIPGEGGSAGSTPEPDEFPAKSALARSFIICAGVIMNFITAIIFYSICVYGGKSYTPPIAGQVAPGQGAWHAGVEAGDRFLNINGNDTPTWLDLKMEIAFASDDEPSRVIIERDGIVLPAMEVLPLENEEQGILVFGIGGAQRLETGEEEGAFSIGPAEAATVAGAPVRGGAMALAMIDRALGAGLTSIRLQKLDGTHHDFTHAAPATPQEPPEQDPGAKVGIVPYGPAVLEAVSGKAGETLSVGDELVAATSAGERIELDSATAVLSLRFRESLEQIVVRKDGKESTRTLHLTNQAEVNAFLDQLDFKTVAGDNRIKAIPAGRIARLNGLYRYPSSPAMEAGIPAGARLVKVGDTETKTFRDIVLAFQDVKAGVPIQLTLRTGAGADSEFVKEITPVALTYLGDAPWQGAQAREHWESKGLGASLVTGVQRTLRETKNVFRTIGSLFAGTISFNKNIAGPITLVRASKTLAEDGALRLLWFLAYVSVMLAVMNILPIPILDGGHLMFIILEKIKGSPLSDKVIFNLQKVGMILLLVLMFFAFKNDITRLLAQ